MALSKNTELDSLKKEVAELKKEVAALKKALAGASKGGADPRVDKIIEALKNESRRFRKCMEGANL